MVRKHRQHHQKRSKFPLKASSSGRYFVDNYGQPFLLVCDSTQAMLGTILVPDIEKYISARANQGIFNAIQPDVVVTPYVSGNTNYSTPDGITPFTGALVTTPRESYFDRLDTIVQLCNAYNMLCVLNPYECGGGLADLTTAGATACQTYGQYLGNRYKKYPNIMWQLGNDFALSSQPSVAQANAVGHIAQGILSVNPNWLMTIELNYLESTAFDNITSYGRYSTTIPMNMNGVYTYGPTYGYNLLGYSNTSTTFAGTSGTNTIPPSPSILLEANYEWEHNGSTDGGSSLNLRKQNFWTTPGGGQAGQIWGNGLFWGFETTAGSNIQLSGYNTGGWANNISSPGALQLGIWKNFCKAVRWYNHVPDQTHLIGTANFGSAGLTGLFAANNYITVSAEPNGNNIVAYFPLGNATNGGTSLTINLATAATSTIIGQWFDPTNGTYSTVSGSPFSNTGTHNFTPTALNNAGDPDMVLLLTS